MTPIKNTVALTLASVCLAFVACNDSKNDVSGSGGASVVFAGTGGMTVAGNSVGGSSRLVGSGATTGSGGITGVGTAAMTVSPGTAGTDSGNGGATTTTGGANSTTGVSGGANGGVGTQGGDAIRTRKITVRGLTFDALETVTPGEPVLLLHGFPETSLEWSRLMPILAANGYHCLAPNQRGYSPDARPAEVDAYRYEELVLDAFAIGSELGERFHVIGHDWGANVGWMMLEKDPSRIASFTAISIPHYQVWARSVYDDEAMASYLSMLNTWMTEGKGEAFWTAEQLRRMWSAKPAEQREVTIAQMTEPGAMTAALNWYRASRGHKRVIEEYNVWKVNVPTLLIHGSKDLAERAITDTASLMTGPYRVVRPDGGHFIVDEQPTVVADETLAHLRAYPMK
jgi:pimeloyl-ACP methyl ester carboxylesterase